LPFLGIIINKAKNAPRFDWVLNDWDLFFLQIRSKKFNEEINKIKDVCLE
jgi:hypothetical protein